MRIAALKSAPFDLVLLDFSMPKMSGLEVARAIASRGLTPKIIVLASMVDANVARDPNILAVCSKPLRRGQVLQTIVSVLKMSDPATASETAASPMLARHVPVKEQQSSNEEDDVLNGICVLIAYHKP